MECIRSGGLSTPIQVVDVTGHVVAEGATIGTGAAVSASLFTLDVYGDRVPVETVQNRLAAIRDKSHLQLEEAWSRLAQM